VPCFRLAAGRSRIRDRPHTLRHTDRSAEFELVTSVSRHLDAIVSHIGKPETVLHELVSELVHVDIHVVVPTPKRNCYTLVTSGMSDRPMNVPAGLEELRFAELVRRPTSRH
jgi:hypothetical protein